MMRNKIVNMLMVIFSVVTLAILFSAFDEEKTQMATSKTITNCGDMAAINH